MPASLTHCNRCAAVVRDEAVVPAGETCMFHMIEGVLTPQEVAHLMALSKTIKFDDGRLSNPDYDKKQNLQPDHRDPGYKESGQLLKNALLRNEYFRDYCLPKTMATPMMTKYMPGMKYGEHVDAGFIPVTPPVRIDVSCTVFISDPATYEGGELQVRLGDQTFKIKGQPGSAVVYPSNTYHQVMPVTKGERIVAITFIESTVRDMQKREILLELTEFMHENAAKVGPDAQMRLEYVRMNLQRMWLDD